MSSGRLIAIYTAAAEGKAMQANASAEAVAGVGLDGDRYADRTGTFSERGGEGREVTLVEREAIAGVNATGIELAEDETRRNLLTEGIALNDLVGQTFRVGAVVLRGVRLCHPCDYLESITRPGVRDALKTRGGLRADIVEGGTLRL